MSINIKRNQIERVYADIETSGEGEEGPILLSDDSDNRFFPAEYRKKKENYLQKYFENATITTREYIPS